jgi:hypothetical protein
MPNSGSSGEEWRCLGNDAATVLEALSRVEEGASVSRLEGFRENGDQTPTRQCGSPVC